MSENLDQVNAQYDQLCIAVENLVEQIQKFRGLYEPTNISLPLVVDTLNDMLMEVDDELNEETF